MASSDGITELLAELDQGNADVTADLIPLIHAHLRRLAAFQFRRERRAHTLSPSDVLQETYIRLMKPGTGPWKNRGHFFGAASTAMRRILVDYARAHRAEKRGSAFQRVDLKNAMSCVGENPKMLLDVDDALIHLAELSKRQARIVELRYFGGLTVSETAGVLHISATTVKEDWVLAKAWLRRELREV